MYWQTPLSKTLDTSSQPAIHSLDTNRRGTLFVTLSPDSLALWHSKPACQLAIVRRTPGSLSKYGNNVSARWSHDGHSLVVLTSTSYLLTYNLLSTASPAFPSLLNTTNNPSRRNISLGDGPGEGNPLIGVRIEGAGISRLKGRCVDLVFGSGKSLLMSVVADETGPASEPNIGKKTAWLIKAPWPLPHALRIHFEKTTRDSTTQEQIRNLPAIDEDGEDQVDVQKWRLSELSCLGDIGDAFVTKIGYTRPSSTYTLLLSSGSAFLAQLSSQRLSHSSGTLSKLAEYGLSPKSESFVLASPPSGAITMARQDSGAGYPFPHVHTSVSKEGERKGPFVALRMWPSETVDGVLGRNDPATSIAFNPKMQYCAFGTQSGKVHLYSIGAHISHKDVRTVLDLSSRIVVDHSPGPVRSLGWSLDGAVLAVVHERCWAVWSAGGVLCSWSLDTETGRKAVSADALWLVGSSSLAVLRSYEEDLHAKVQISEFVKTVDAFHTNAYDSQQSLLLGDDFVFVCKPAEAVAHATIAKETSLQVKFPLPYISTNWPIRFTSISADGKLLAVAGKDGFTHYSFTSGRWKLFENIQEETEFSVRGGLVWYHHVLVVGVETDDGHEVRLYTRDLDLAAKNCVYTQTFNHAVVHLALDDNSLLVYTADNMLYHFIISPTRDRIRLESCGSISLVDLIPSPTRMKMLAWSVPDLNRMHGDPANDLLVAHLIVLLEDQLIILQPSTTQNREIRYEPHTLTTGVQHFWMNADTVNLPGDSLWVLVGMRMQVYLVEGMKQRKHGECAWTLAFAVDLGFQPLRVDPSQGSILGLSDLSLRTLDTADLDASQRVARYIPLLLRHFLTTHRFERALTTAQRYASHTSFNLILEVLLHETLEQYVEGKSISDEVELSSRHDLERAIELIDHFDVGLQVVVSCARKTEMDRWQPLFELIGEPSTLVESCLAKSPPDLKTAVAYLLVQQSLQGTSSDLTRDSIKLLKVGLEFGDYSTCQEIIRFLHIVDSSGEKLRLAVEASGLVDPVYTEEG